MSTDRGAALVHKWKYRFGLGHYRITVQAMRQQDLADAWAMSFFDTHEEWALIELPPDDTIPDSTLELLVLHELAHGLLKVVGADDEGTPLEAACNRIARLASGDFLSPFGNEHAASVLGDSWYDVETDRRAAKVDRHAWLSIVADALPEHQREAVNLVYFEGLSYREAGKVLGITGTSVEDRCHVAFRRMKECYEALDKEFGDA